MFFLGYMVGAPLNNERSFNHNSIDNRSYDRPSHLPVYRENSLTSSGSMPRRHPESKFANDSVERRLGEIVRTNKPTEPTDVNVLANNQQAIWKRDKQSMESPSLHVKPPGENTLRRQGKTQFKPLPKLEVLNWADGLPNTSQADGDNSPPASPKASSAFSEAENARTDSRISHGGSSNSLNKFPSSHRRRRNSNASSMMSSELYQSEMDPSGYSDVLSDRKKKKEKSIPPPIHFDGLTSDILLQWAESVTNSSPSSSGSSSPSRLSGISSEGSLYTDEDFAQAVAAVAECGGFNMDYDYNLPGINTAPAPPQVPLSATRNSKMNKIDQVLAQRQKSLNPPAASKIASSQPPSSFVPQISMSNYLPGSTKGKPSNYRNGGSRLPKKEKASNHPDFDDIDSSKPLTMSNLMKHDSSLDRGKKDPAKPLTMSNLRQHDSSLDRDRDRRKPALPPGYCKPPPYDSNHDTRESQHPLPEAPKLVTSALERHESMNSNSRDSVNSSNRHDSEVENNIGTSERNQQRKLKNFNINRDPKSSTSTVNTVRSSPEYDDEDDYEANC